MKTKFVIFLAVAFSFLGCGKKNKTGEYLVALPPSAPQKTKQIKVAPLEVKSEDIVLKVSRLVELKNDLSNQSEFTKYLNHHHVVAEMPDGAGVGYFLRCKESDKDVSPAHSPFFTITHKVARATFELVYKSDQLKHEYQCEVLDPGGNVLFEQKFAIKKDLIIEKRSTLNENVDVGALVFFDHSTLFTNGSRLNIKADVFLGGTMSTIETFDESDLSSPPNVPGMGGGQISVEVNRSVGELIVNLRGKNAGAITTVDSSYSQFEVPRTCAHGTYVQSITFHRKGQTGLPGGNTGSFNLKAHKQSMSIVIQKFPGKGGLGQVSLNPATELKLQYTADDDALGIVRAPKLGDTITPQWNESNYNVNGTVCFVKTIGSRGKYSRFKYTVINVRKLPSLNLESAAQTQRGGRGLNGKEDKSCINEESTKTQECN